MISGPTAAALVEWRESVAAIYRDVRETHDADPEVAWLRFREQRDRLYKRHPCSALTDEEKRSFAGFAYHEYDPNSCIVGEIDYAVAEFSLDIEVSEGTLHCRRIGVARFSHARQTASLDLFWLDTMAVDFGCLSATKRTGRRLIAAAAISMIRRKAQT